MKRQLHCLTLIAALLAILVSLSGAPAIGALAGPDQPALQPEGAALSAGGDAPSGEPVELLDVTVTLEDGAAGGVYQPAAAAGLQAGYDHRIFLPLITDPYREPPPRTPPAAPTGLKAGLSEYSGFILRWTDRSSDETGFRIERKVSGVNSDYVELATVGSNKTEYFDSSSPIHYEKEYTYRVTAVNPAGSSNPAVITFTAPAPPAVKPAAPANCWVEAITPT